MTGKRVYKLIDWPLLQAVIDVIHPVFIRLTNEGFLEKCTQGHSQNGNESFITLVWSLSPKENYNNPLETSLAIDLAVKVKLEIDPVMSRQWKALVRLRVLSGECKCREETKLK